MFVLLSMGESQTHFKFKLSLANEFDFAKRRPVLMAAFIPGEKNGLIKLNILDVVEAEVPVVSKERRSNRHFVINAVKRNITDQV